MFNSNYITVMLGQLLLVSTLHLLCAAYHMGSHPGPGSWCEEDTEADPSGRSWHGPGTNRAAWAVQLQNEALPCR